MQRLLLGLVAFALAGTGVFVIAGRNGTSFKTNREPPLSNERSVGPATCGDSVRDLVNRLGQAPRRPTSSSPTAQVRAIAAEVERIRGLKFAKQITPTFLSQEQLNRRVTESIKEDFSEESSDADTRVLIALGAIPPGKDVKSLVEEVLSEQVLGFYDSEEGKIVVGTTDPDLLLTPLARVTMAHELDHALADQALGLPDIRSSAEDGQEDASLAALALIEGDATLVMQIYAFTSLSAADQAAMLQDPAVAGGATQSEDAPPYLEQALEFPYLTGLGFVCDLLLPDGAWGSIDGAYKDPPKTSAQVMFPDRYRAHEPAVDAPDSASPGEGWSEAAFYALGAADLAFLFDAPGGDETEGLSLPIARAADWAGGELRLWTRDALSAVGVSLVERSQGRALCSSVLEWYTRSFPKDKKVSSEKGEELAVDGRTQDAVLKCDQKVVRLGIGPDLTTARLMAK